MIQLILSLYLLTLIYEPLGAITKYHSTLITVAKLCWVLSNLSWNLWVLDQSHRPMETLHSSLFPPPCSQFCPLIQIFFQ